MERAGVRAKSRPGQIGRHVILEGLHYDLGPVDLRPEVLSREECEGFVLEHVAFNTTPWFRVNGSFLLPTGVTYPVPGRVGPAAGPRQSLSS